MTAREQVERLLAEVLWSREYRHAPTLRDEHPEVQRGFREDAEFILASEWMSTHDAEVRADERRRVLAEVVRWLRENGYPDCPTNEEDAFDEAAAEFEGWVAKSANAPESHKTAPLSAATGRGPARRPSGGAETATGAES